MSLEQEIGKLKQKFETVIADLSTLTVVTLVGQVNAKYDATKGWDVVPDATAKAIAFTEIRIDGDIATVVPATDGGKPDKDWMDVHAAAVKAATDGRAALIQSIAAVIKSF